MSCASLLFTVEDREGSLEEVLKIFKSLSISLCRIESRPSKSFKWKYDIVVDFRIPDGAMMKELEKRLQERGSSYQFMESSASHGDHDSESKVKMTPWFPKCLSDTDAFAERVLECGEDLAADHPGFTDQVYRARRADITNIAKQYKTGMQIARIQYTEEEIATWRTVYEKLMTLYPTHSCKEHQFILPLLNQNCGYGPDQIPQLQDISDFLKKCTGFTLKPVMGLLSSRDFLNGLAFRVFHSTQYIRHASKPFYTPEPDVCHELLGHVPLFADPDFAAFSQEIGLCSLGASDEDIKKLATIYWFTVEFGLCKQGDEVKAYGAGILSSFGELEYALSENSIKVPFDPEKAANQEYPITNYQPLYFVADSFRSAQEKVREWAAANLSRPFAVRYNPYTQSIEILDTAQKIGRVAQNLKGELESVIEALKKLE